jgi:hypothetical protein
MGKRLCLSLLVEMPEDPFDAAGVYVSLKEPWGTLLKSLAASGVKHEAKADEMEIRAKAKRGPRKAKLGLVPPPTGEAA